jgi:hypothetical protein
MVYCLALTLWCIKIGYRTPDILFPVYPAINLDIYQMSPSLLNSFKDPILNFMFLLEVAKHFFPDPWMDPKTNMFLSPSCAPDIFL